MRKGFFERVQALLLGVLFLIGSLVPANALAWDKTKTWLENQLKDSGTTPGYINKAINRARTKWDKNNDNKADPGSGSLTTIPGLGNRKYWQGDLALDTLPESLIAYFEDMVVNFSEDLDGCFDPEVDIDWGWDIDVNLELWWPVYEVHTHPIFQNRRGDIYPLLSAAAAVFGVNVFPSTMSFPQPYPALYMADAHAWTPYLLPAGSGGIPLPPLGAYSNFRYFIQPMMMGHAKYQMHDDLITKHGPLAAVFAAVGLQGPWVPTSATDLAMYAAPKADKQLRYNPANPYNLQFLDTALNSQLDDLELDALGPGVPGAPAAREYRYGSTEQSGRHALEFSVTPTLFTLLWRFIPVVNGMLAVLPSGCRPPTKLAYPWDSDRMELFYQTRDPFLGKMSYVRDTGFQQDYNRWLTNPKYCSEYKMTNHPSYANIPRDQFDAAIDLPLLPDLDLPDLLNPLSTSSASNLHRMCTPRVGPNVPFTIHNGPMGVEILSALQNIEKASRLSNAYYRELIQTNPELAAVFTFRMINEATDKIQFTYHDDVPNRCYKFGQLGELFSNANAMVKKGDYGLYSATMWHRYRCDISLGHIALILGTLWALGPVIVGLALFT